jgi:hypothetical protein
LTDIQGAHFTVGVSHHLDEARRRGDQCSDLDDEFVEALAQTTTSGAQICPSEWVVDQYQ